MNKTYKKPKFPLTTLIICTILTIAILIIYYFTKVTFILFYLSPVIVAFIIIIIYYICKMVEYVRDLKSLLEEKYTFKIPDFKYDIQPYHYNKIIMPFVSFAEYTNNIYYYNNAKEHYQQQINACHFLHRDDSEFITQRNKYEELCKEEQSKISLLNIDDTFFTNIREEFSDTIKKFNDLFYDDICAKFKYGFLKDIDYRLVLDNKKDYMYAFVFPLVIVINYTSCTVKAFEFNHINVDLDVLFDGTSNCEFVFSIDNDIVFKHECEDNSITDSLYYNYTKARNIVTRLYKSEYYQQIVKDSTTDDIDIYYSPEYVDMTMYAKYNYIDEKKKEKNKKEPAEKKAKATKNQKRKAIETSKEQLIENIIPKAAKTQEEQIIQGKESDINVSNKEKVEETQKETSNDSEVQNIQYKNRLHGIILPDSLVNPKNGKPVDPGKICGGKVISHEEFYEGNEKMHKFIVEKRLLTEKEINDKTYDQMINNLLKDKDVIIPEGTRKIKERKFSYNSTIEKVVFPEGLEEIGESAFSNCQNLKEIVFPKSIKKIGRAAFTGCENIEAVYIPDLVSWNKIYLKYTTSDVPSSYSRFNIDSCEYEYNPGYTSLQKKEAILFESDVIDDGSNPLKYAKRVYIGNEIITDLEIPKEIKTMKSLNFKYFPGIKKVTFPNTIKTMNKGLFAFSDVEEVIFDADENCEFKDVFDARTYIESYFGEKIKKVVFKKYYPNLPRLSSKIDNLYIDAPYYKLQDFNNVNNQCLALDKYVRFKAQGREFPPELIKNYDSFINRHVNGIYQKIYSYPYLFKYIIDNKLLQIDKALSLQKLYNSEMNYECNRMLKEYVLSIDPTAYDTDDPIINGLDKEWLYEDVDGGVKITKCKLPKTIERILIPDYLDYKKVVEIDASVFSTRNQLEVVHLPKFLTKLGADAFLNCRNLKDIYINNLLEEISSSSFSVGYSMSLGDYCVPRKYHFNSLSVLKYSMNVKGLNVKYLEYGTIYINDKPYTL